MSLQDEFRQAVPSEDELIATDRQIGKEGASPHKCPSKSQLLLFVAGRYNKAQVAEISKHLAECNSCADVLADIRHQQKVADRRVFPKNKLLLAAIAAAVLIAALLMTWLIRSRVPSETVTADLRNVTRGVDTESDSGVILHRNTRHLRILLSPQAVAGDYEIAVFNPEDRASPLITRSASSSRENDSLVLEASVVVSNLQSGPYLLGIRHNDSEWIYYEIRID